MPTVILVKPIKRGEETITRIDLRDLDNAGDLRGVSLSKVIEMDTNTLLTLIKRLSTTPLSPEEIDQIGPADLLSLTVEIAGFFNASPSPSRTTH